MIQSILIQLNESIRWNITFPAGYAQILLSRSQLLFELIGVDDVHVEHPDADGTAFDDGSAVEQYGHRVHIGADNDLLHFAFGQHQVEKLGPRHVPESETGISSLPKCFVDLETGGLPHDFGLVPAGEQQRQHRYQNVARYGPE